MAPLKSVEDSAKEAHARQTTLVIGDGDIVRIIPLTPTAPETNPYNRDREQYRIVVYIPQSDTIKQLVLTDSRMRKLNDKCGDWTNLACSVTFHRKGSDRANTSYTFGDLMQGDTAEKEYQRGLELLADRDEEGWEAFREWAGEQINTKAKPAADSAKKK